MSITTAATFSDVGRSIAPGEAPDNWKWKIAGPVLLLICLAGPIGMLWATRDCPGMTADSRTYLMEAESARRGDGVMMYNREGHLYSQAQYPPMYPIIIAVGSALSKNLHAVARWLNAIFFFGTIALAAAIVRTTRIGQSGKTSRTLALTAAAVIAASFESLQIYAMIWSEGAFMFFALLSMFLLSLASRLEERRKAYHWLFFGSAAAAAIAFGTRFAGACLIPPACVVFLFDRKSCWRSKLLRIVLFVLIASSIAGPWVIRHAINMHSLANRTIALHRPGPQIWQSGATTVTGWFAYGWKGNPNPFGAAVLVLLVLAACVGRFRSRGTFRNWSAAGDLSFLFIATYVPFIAFTLFLVDAYMPLDRRILFPLFVAVILTAASWASAWNQPRSSKAVRTIVVGICMALVTLKAVHGIQWVNAAPAKWLGYGTKQWTHSALIERVRSLPRYRLIYSNAEDAVYLHTGILVKALPGKFEASAVTKDKKYAEKMKLLRTHIRQRKAYIVYFSSIKRSYHATEKELQRQLRLVVIQQDRYGVIMKSADSPLPPNASTTKPSGSVNPIK